MDTNYTKKNPHSCPYCYSMDAEEEKYEQFVWSYKCEVCGTQWTVVYPDTPKEVEIERGPMYYERGDFEKRPEFIKDVDPKSPLGKELKK